MKTSPCKYCRDRYVGCHSQCIKYIDFQQMNEVIKQKRVEMNGINEYERARSRKIYKWKWSNGE